MPTRTEEKASDLINLFQSLRFNQIPVMKVVTIQHEGHAVDLLIVKDMPEKPYFMLQEYSDGRERVRAGAVYLRVGENNTPKDRTADDVRVERMYRQRFGIDRSPLERVRTYLQDSDHWERDYAEENRQFFRYEPFPEFTFIKACGERSIRYAMGTGIPRYLGKPRHVLPQIPRHRFGHDLLSLV